MFVTAHTIWHVIVIKTKQRAKAQKTIQEPKGNKMIRTRYYTPKQKQSSCVQVTVEGIPVTGLIDTGSDITIIRGDLFYHIVETAKLERKVILNLPDLKACLYDQKPITLDGQIDLLGKKVICTTVYVKLVAPDQLLLSEAVCCQLGIVSYHPSVQSVQKCHSAENYHNKSKSYQICTLTCQLFSHSSSAN